MSNYTNMQYKKMCLQYMFEAGEIVTSLNDRLCFVLDSLVFEHTGTVFYNVSM